MIGTPAISLWYFLSTRQNTLLQLFPIMSHDSITLPRHGRLYLNLHRPGGAGTRIQQTYHLRVVSNCNVATLSRPGRKWLCGPPMMIKSCTKMLAARGVPPHQIGFDEF